MITVQYGSVQLPLAPGSLGGWQAWFHPHLLQWESCHVWLKGSPDGLLLAVGFFNILWALWRCLHCSHSISQACCELLVFCWALGVLRFLGFSGLMWILHKFLMWENKQTALFDNLMLSQHFREHVSLARKIFIYLYLAVILFDLKSWFLSSTLTLRLLSLPKFENLMKIYKL